MMSLRPAFESLTATATVLSLLGYASAAAAATESTCETDADCGKGMTCEVVGGGECPAIDIACDPDGKCPEPEPCEAIEERACVPGAACESDADCGEGMVCYTHTEERCSGGAPAAKPCPSDVDCGDPEPPVEEVCTTETEQLCVPKYMLPCTVAADCGAGFECVEEQSCSCGGSAGTGGASMPDSSGGGEGDSFAPLPPEEESGCSCEPSGRSVCEPQQESCTDDSDCPADWTCEDFGTVSSGPCASSSNGAEDVACDPVETVTHDYRCAAPSHYGGRGVAEDSSENGKGTAGNPSAPSADVGGDDDGLAEVEMGSDSDSDSGGCRMTPRRTTPSAAALLFGLLGFASLARRRPGRR